ncbi:MAG: YihY/virulence factor BrkB family protein [Ruminococcus sp.]|jgi:membrane protein
MKNFLKIVNGFIDRSNRDHISAYAAQSAYFILLSFIPFILLLMTSVRYTPLTQNMVLEAVVRVVPEEFQSFVKQIILEVYSKSLAVVPLTAIITLWTAGKGLQGLTNGLNSVYQVYETRNYFAARIRSAVYTLIFILIIIATLILLVFGNSIQHALVEHVPFISNVTRSILQMRTVLSLVVLSCVFLMMYKFLPNRKASMKSQLPGAVISAVAWSVFSLFFSIYLEYFKVTNMYGSLTTLIMIMLWMYFCMFIFLLGAEVNAYFEDKFRMLQQTAMDHLRMEVRSISGQENDEGEEETEKK